MAALTLKDDGYPHFKKIMKKGKWIGRVARMPDGTFFGNMPIRFTHTASKGSE